MLTKKLKTVRFQLYHSFENLVAGLLAPILPLGYLENQIRPPVIIPYYHIVSDERVEHVIHLFSYRTTEQFKADLEFFLKNYQPVGLEDLLSAVATGRRLKERAFLLSVDDGFRETHDIMAPILKSKGVPAVFFITTAFLDNKTLGHRHKASILAEHFARLKNRPPIAEKLAEVLKCHDSSHPGIIKAIMSRDNMGRETLDNMASVLEVDFESYLSGVQPYLTTSQVRSLIQDGFHIGAHSVDHFHYGTLTPGEQLAQTSDSVTFIRQKFGLNYSLFAFPYSDSGVHASLFEALGGEIDVFFGTSAFRRDRIKKLVQRFWMEDTSDSAEKILKSLYVRNKVREFAGLNKRNR